MEDGDVDAENELALAKIDDTDAKNRDFRHGHEQERAWEGVDDLKAHDYGDDDGDGGDDDLEHRHLHLDHHLQHPKINLRGTVTHDSSVDIEFESSPSMIIGDEAIYTARSLGDFGDANRKSGTLTQSFYLSPNKNTDLQRHERFVANLSCKAGNFDDCDVEGPCSPLRLEIRKLVNKVRKLLVETGFSEESALSVTKNRANIDLDVEELLSSESPKEHPFVQRSQDHSLCMLCNNPAEEHSNPDGVCEQTFRFHCKQILDLLDEYQGMRKRVMVEEGELCVICYQKYTSVEEIYSLHCRHFACKTCFSDYIRYQVENGNLLKLSCPMHDCPVMISLENVKELVDKDLFNRFERYYEAYSVSADPDLRYCANPKCEIILKRGDPSNPYENCIGCGGKTCWECGKKWHPRIDCTKYEDVVFQRYAREYDVKQCPHCQMQFQQLDSDAPCKHVTCQICNYNWCWDCQQRIKIRHFDPSNPDCCPVVRYPKWKLRLFKIRKGVLFCACAPCIFILWPGRFLTREFVPQIKKAKDYFKAFLVFLISIILLPIIYVILLVVMIVTCFKSNLRQRVGSCKRRPRRQGEDSQVERDEQGDEDEKRRTNGDLENPADESTS